MRPVPRARHRTVGVESQTLHTRNKSVFAAPSTARRTSVQSVSAESNALTTTEIAKLQRHGLVSLPFRTSILPPHVWQTPKSGSERRPSCRSGEHLPQQRQCQWPLV